MFTLPKLPFAFNALEPNIDAQTMEIHLTKHHATYVKNLNDALATLPDMAEKTESDLPNILSDLDTLPTDIQMKVQNNGGGHWNHSFFWQILTPSNTSGQPSTELLSTINTSFGNQEEFKSKLITKALSRFGSGWIWVIKTPFGLEIVDTPNQDNPVMNHQTPILGIDIWEHAYYLKYQNRRNEYLEAVWQIINWSEVSRLFSVTL